MDFLDTLNTLDIFDTLDSLDTLYTVDIFDILGTLNTLDIMDILMKPHLASLKQRQQAQRKLNQHLASLNQRQQAQRKEGMSGASSRGNMNVQKQFNIDRSIGHRSAINDNLTLIDGSVIAPPNMPRIEQVRYPNRSCGAMCVPAGVNFYKRRGGGICGGMKFFLVGE